MKEIRVSEGIFVLQYIHVKREMRISHVSEIHIKRIRVNQGVGVLATLRYVSILEENMQFEFKPFNYTIVSNFISNYHSWALTLFLMFLIKKFKHQNSNYKATIISILITQCKAVAIQFTQFVLYKQKIQQLMQKVIQYLLV